MTKGKQAVKNTKQKNTTTTKNTNAKQKKENSVSVKEVKVKETTSKSKTQTVKNTSKNESTKKDTIKKDTKKKKSPIRYVLYVVIVILLGIFVFSGYHIISWKIDNSKTQELIDDLESSTKVKNVSGENVDIFAEFNDENVLQYLTMDFIDVDLKDVKKDNKEAIGWIQVAGTKVNYPFVQTNNNDYYLTHSIDKTSNEAGWIFADYRNKLWQDRNTILYGHGRLNKTMFGSLNDILDNGWTDNSDNFVIKISTEDESSVWQIFSAYHTANEANPYYSKINFKSDDEFAKFAKKLLDKSMFDFKTTVSESDTIITLSTCYNNNEKMVVHAKLLKKYYKNTITNEKDK